MASSGAQPSHPTASDANPSSFLATIPDDIILYFIPLLEMIEIIYFLESNFPLSGRCILYLELKNFMDGKRLAHAAASMNCRIALRRLHGAGCNMIKGDEDGWTPLHYVIYPATVEPFMREPPVYRNSPDAPFTSRPYDFDQLEACKTIYALCLNGHTLKAEGRETAEVRLPYSFKIAHPLNLETKFEFLGRDDANHTALSLAVDYFQTVICKRLLIEGTYIKLREIDETKSNWKWFLRKMRKWDRFPELKHRKKGWYCMKRSSETNDVPPWAHWKKRQAQQNFQ